jgi:hypothetical protein
MIASMAAFAIEDAFLKTVTKQLPVGQVLMMFGAAGLCVFALMARRAGASIFQAQVLTKNMCSGQFLSSLDGCFMSWPLP